MTNLYDLLSRTELEQMLEERRVFKQVHPTLPISIYNYTTRAQVLDKWTQTERVCRGLIVEDGSNKVIARGPEKFFNYGQKGAPILPLDSLTRVTTKHDGSLGIAWVYDGHVGIATRGSFTSEQAKHATAFVDEFEELREDILKGSAVRFAHGGSTPIFEIVYPENRIVLDYGNRDEVIPLGLVDNEDGKIHFRPEEMYQTGVITLAEAIKMEVPDDEEGYVLDIQPFGETHHVKLKGETYKVLHALLTNTTGRRIWVQMAARACHHWIEKDQDWAKYLKHDPEDFKRVKIEKDIVDTLLTNVPDEFYDWVTKKIDGINDQVSDLVIQAILLGGQLTMVDDTRKRHELVKDHPLCKEILNYVQSRDESRIILRAWQLAKPEGDDTPFKTQED